LDCILAELGARRQSAEMEAVRSRRIVALSAEREWQARAAGIAEAASVVRTIMQSNAERSHSRENL
jgi:hypothetical protein